MSDKKCYSINNEDFSYDELDDAVIAALEEPDVSVGDVVTVYEGDAVPWKAGDFTGWNLDHITNAAYDEGGEYAEDYLSGVTKEQEADLDKRVADAVNQWADDHGLHPNFYQVRNVKEHRFVMTSETGDYEPSEI